MSLFVAPVSVRHAPLAGGRLAWTLCLLAAALLAFPAHAADDAAPAPPPPAVADDELPPGEDDAAAPSLELAAFLEQLRHPPLVASWAIMSGTVQHKADGQPLKRFGIEARALFSPRRTQAQLSFNEHERYLVRQTFSDGRQGTTIIREREAPPGQLSLGDIGLRPGDLTLSFLYWDFVEELPSQTIKTRRCRVLRLRDPESREQVVVWVTVREVFPLRVSWYREGEGQRYRELEFTGFERQHETWIVKRLQVSNPGWKTQVDFQRIKLELVTDAARPPADLFLPAATP